MRCLHSVCVWVFGMWWTSSSDFFPPPAQQKIINQSNSREEWKEGRKEGMEITNKYK